MIKLEKFTRSDFKQLINWIDSEEFLIQWSGNAFTYPLDEQQLERYTDSANYEKGKYTRFQSNR